MSNTAEIHESDRIVQRQAPDEDVNAHIGGRLRQARERAGLSQVEFAKQLAIPRKRLAQYEAGTRQLTVNDLVEACALLGINPLYLFDDDDHAAVGTMQPSRADAQWSSGEETEAVVQAFAQIPDQETRDDMMALLRAMGPRHTV